MKRKNYLDSTGYTATALLAIGMHAALVAQKTGLTISQVYKLSRKTGVSARDYRDGRNAFARRNLAEVNSVQHYRILKNILRSKMLRG